MVRRTREDGANALRIGSHVFTLDRLLELHETNPERFALSNPRWGSALAMGKTALLERRALNPRRFDHYHPFLGWLLRDAFPDELTNTGGPFPPIVPPVPPIDTGGGGPPPDDGGGGPPGPQAVPEPPGYALMASAVVGIGLLRLARAKVLGRRGRGVGAGPIRPKA